jgi:hypothetical protein
MSKPQTLAIKIGMIDAANVSPHENPMMMQAVTKSSVNLCFVFSIQPPFDVYNFLKIFF